MKCVNFPWKAVLIEAVPLIFLVILYLVSLVILDDEGDTQGGAGVPPAQNGEVSK